MKTDRNCFQCTHIRPNNGPDFEVSGQCDRLSGVDGIADGNCTIYSGVFAVMCLNYSVKHNNELKEEEVLPPCQDKPRYLRSLIGKKCMKSQGLLKGIIAILKKMSFM